MSKFIYVISSAKSDNSPCKIGISDNPEKRVKQLQTGHPEKLEIKFMKKLENARLYEKLLHIDIAMNDTDASIRQTATDMKNKSNMS